MGTIARVRKLARKASVAYLKQREALGFPLLRDEAERAKWVKVGEAADALATEAGAAVAARGEGARK